MPPTSEKFGSFSGGVTLRSVPPLDPEDLPPGPAATRPGAEDGAESVIWSAEADDATFSPADSPLGSSTSAYRPRRLTPYEAPPAIMASAPAQTNMPRKSPMSIDISSPMTYADTSTPSMVFANQALVPILGLRNQRYAPNAASAPATRPAVPHPQSDTTPARARYESHASSLTNVARSVTGVPDAVRTTLSVVAPSACAKSTTQNTLVPTDS